MTNEVLVVQLKSKSQRMQAERPQPKRNQKNLYKPPPEQDYANSYKRLIIVILISFVFIGSEIAAGIISNSIAIISDAIHLITDLVGFVFSFLFLYLSKKAPTSKMTFGYHRMELLGALSNLFIIYVLLLFVVFEASERIIARQHVERPFVMFITACGGLIVNIVMYKVLHGADSHGHGLLGDQCQHDHSEHEGAQHRHGPRDENSMNKLDFDGGEDIQCGESLCTDGECNQMVQTAHCHKNSNIHKHKNTEKKPRKLPPIEQKGVVAKMCEQIQVKGQGNKSALENVYCDLDHEHQNTCYLKKEENHKEERKEEHSHNKEHKHEHNHNHQHGHEHKHEHKHSHSHHHHHEHERHSHDSNENENEAERHKSLGMQAAILHALADMIMSIGLIFSSLVIFLLGSPNGYLEPVHEWNAWHLFDPISTYIFAIITLASTFPVLRNSYYLMMESTPSYINIDELKKEFEKIEGVIDVHDIHVWDLKSSKTVAIAHVLAKKDTERSVLVSLSDIARKKKIFHSTFQVQEQEWKDEEDYILCHHDIH